VADEYAAEFSDAASERGAVLVQIGLVVAGLVLLVLGARWLVDAAITMARSMGVSELVIGLTIVAAGTSMPEVATSVLAAFRGERDIAVGNVVGSNLFNVLAVLGLSGVAGDGIDVAPAVLSFDLPVALAVAVACLPITFSGHLIARWEGVLFLAYYVAYTAYVILAASAHDALPAFSAAMAWFVLPLTAVTVLVVAWRTGAGRRA
jgi:cation:H+ antiporter